MCARYIWAEKDFSYLLTVALRSLYSILMGGYETKILCMSWRPIWLLDKGQDGKFRNGENNGGKLSHSSDVIDTCSYIHVFTPVSICMWMCVALSIVVGAWSMVMLLWWPSCWIFYTVTSSERGIRITQSVAIDMVSMGWPLVDSWD